MKSEGSSFPQVLHMIVVSLPLLYSNWYVGVSHCRQIRYSGSSTAEKDSTAQRVVSVGAPKLAWTKRAVVVAFSITDA